MNINYKIYFLLVAVAGFSSCKKWLDVKPKTQIESGDHFKTEQGFQDALTGVYLNMAKPAVYGKELSYGLVDVLGKNYTQFYYSEDYLNDSRYNYAFRSTKARIDAIWKESYFSIANVNNLIANLETADRNLFEGTNYNVIKGEAYALRAFNHFDLLRLFAPAPSVAGGNVKAIPYRSSFENGNVQVGTVAEFIAKLIADLELASSLLKDSDPIASTTNAPAGGYLRDRTFKLNYYAVRALMARIYLYQGDKDKALACAKEVIESQKFPATSVSQIVAGNKIMSTEVIFSLYKNTLAADYNFSFSGVPTSTGMYLSSSEWSDVYELSNGGSSDYRYLYQTEIVNYSRYTTKFRPAANGTSGTAWENRLPLMRVSEMYDIAAECLAETDPGSAVGYLNAIRATRNLPGLPNGLTTAIIQNEVFKEYRKDFITEGQLFFYYKRLNKAQIAFSQIPGDAKVYVLPLPDDEIEFGNQ